MKIITKELVKRLPLNHSFLQYKVVDLQKTKNIIQILRESQNITIYERTYMPQLKEGKIIGVKDHINRTGTNPLIGRQKELNIDFIDIQKIYKKEKNQIITNCCGKKLNSQYLYASHYLCNIAYIARALQYNNITAYLVNTP
tara:strand:- start:7812 stop:8237 length:426 start_codon:yes stop_codon:yes gene_type:complete